MKDSFKLLGVVIISACAVFVSTLFLNYNMDLVGIESMITTEEMRRLYDALVMTGTVVSGVSGGCLLMTSVVMLFFYIKHYIDAHRKELGILKAMGYSNIRIARGFWVFGLSVFAGTALGYAGAHCIMPLFYSTQNEDQLLPEVTISFQPVLLFCLVLLPTVVFALLSIGYSCLKLGTPVLELLKGKSISKVRNVKTNADLTFVEELKKNTVKQRKSLVFFIAFAAFCYAAMMQMSFGVDELSSIMMSLMTLLIGVVLAAVTLFLATTTVVKANQKAIAVMRVMGYLSGECSKAILNGYRPIAYIGFVIGTVYQYALLKIMVGVVFKEIENIPEFHFDIKAFGITLVSFVLLYEAIMYCYARNIGKMSVKEIMLDAE